MLVPPGWGRKIMAAAVSFGPARDTRKVGILHKRRGKHMDKLKKRRATIGIAQNIDLTFTMIGVYLTLSFIQVTFVTAA